jgi:hypothetical protein
MPEEPSTRSPHDAARAMLEAFAGVGASCFDVTWTNIAGDPRRPRTLRNALRVLGGALPKPENDDWLDSVHIKGIGADDLMRIVPAMLETADADRLNLIVRPFGPGVSVIQLDDLTPILLPRIAPPGFSVSEPHQHRRRWQLSGVARDACPGASTPRRRQGICPPRTQRRRSGSQCQRRHAHRRQPEF